MTYSHDEAAAAIARAEAAMAAAEAAREAAERLREQIAAAQAGGAR